MTPEQIAQAAYERAVRKREAARYVASKVPLELAVEARQNYKVRAQEADRALEDWMKLRGLVPA